MSTVTLKRIFLKKQKQTRERATRGQGATSSYFNKIPGSSYIHDSEGPIALSLGLTNLPGQYISCPVVRASFVSNTPPKCLDLEGL